MKKIPLILMLCLWIFSCDDLEITNPLHPDFDTKLHIDKSTQIVVPYTKGSFSIEVTSNVDWTVSSSDSWLTYSPDNGSNNGT
ncbi:BACON domain-containing protein, partial [Vibrio sp.]|uniref:BACON domain-containing protein n=1 Tax=Vibrio sp. TaxID=678 RepID=UPI003D0AA1BB